MTDVNQKAEWYVPAIASADLKELPKALCPTVFDPLNYKTNKDVTGAQLQKEFKEIAQATGGQVFNFSPERLALHETIIAVSTQIKVKSEEEFVAACKDIYENHVLPLLESKKGEIESRNKELRARALDAVKQFFHAGKPDYDYLSNTGRSRIDDSFFPELRDVNKKFSQNTNYLRQELSLLEDKEKKNKSSFTRRERERVEVIKDTINFFETRENRVGILHREVAEELILKANQKAIKKWVAGESGLLSSPEISAKYEHLTQHGADTRHGFLVVGGAASGKGSVTALVKQSQSDPHDIVELNPDLYKRMLLSKDNMPKEYKEHHGSLTHVESSIVMDRIAERWQEMAIAGKAPNILMDVARAGSWMREIIRSGNTHVEIHTPMLPALTALTRSFERGKKEEAKTGVPRYMPTPDLLRGHKDQLVVNLQAIKDGFDITFYSTDVPANSNPMTLPITAQYTGKNKDFAIHDMSVMWDYFQKGALNTDAINEHQLSKATAKSTAKAMLDYANEVTSIRLLNAHTEIVHLVKVEGERPEEYTYIFEVRNWQALKEHMGEVNAHNLLQGLYENTMQEGPYKDKVTIKGNGVEAIVADIADELARRPKSAGLDDRSASNGVGHNVDEYAQLLERLVDKGHEIVKTADNMVYDLAANKEQFPAGVRFIMQNLYDDTKNTSYNYNPNDASATPQYLIFDPSVHKTTEDRKKVLAELIAASREGNDYKQKGIWLAPQKKINRDYIPADSTDNVDGFIRMHPKPDQPRIALIMDEPTHLFANWLGDNGTADQTLEKDAAVVIRKEDIGILTEALNTYHHTGNPLELFNKSWLDVKENEAFDPKIISLTPEEEPQLRKAIAKYHESGDWGYLTSDQSNEKPEAFNVIGRVPSLIDVYGTDPFFVHDNYSYIPMKEPDYRMLMQRIIAEGVMLSNDAVLGSENAYVALELAPGEFAALPDGEYGNPVKGPCHVGVRVKDFALLSKAVETDGSLLMNGQATYPITVLDPETASKFSQSPLGEHFKRIKLRESSWAAKA